MQSRRWSAFAKRPARIIPRRNPIWAFVTNGATAWQSMRWRPTSGICWRRRKGTAKGSAMRPCWSCCCRRNRLRRGNGGRRIGSNSARSHPPTTDNPMRTILIAALVCTASMLLPSAHAQPSDADTQQLTSLRAKAETGDAKSQFVFGAAYSLGKFGLATNHVEAVKWYRKAAEQNHALAQCNLAWCFAEGQGVTKDQVEAYKWNLLAAAQGLGPAREAATRLERRLTRAQLAEGQKRARDFKLPEVPSLAPREAEARGQPSADLRAQVATGEQKAQNEWRTAFHDGKQGVAKDSLADR